MKRWIVSLLLLATAALGDTVRPAYLEIVETSPGAVDIVWKLPIQQDLPPELAPVLPNSFTPSSPFELIDAPDAVTKKWSMIGDPLAGQTIRIEALNQTAMEALVRIELADGSTYRIVFRPTDPEFQIPVALESQSNAPRTRWVYPALFIAAAALSLTPSAKKRGIAMCCVALIIGSLVGNAIGSILPKSTPRLDEEAVGKVIEGLMLNTYRAFILDVDEEVYDVLARSVDGAALNDIYLENRDRLTFNDEESAASLVDRLDVKTIGSMRYNKDGSITMHTDWDVYGTVFHWEHVHFRCNAFTAEITIIPADDYWKITHLEVLDEKRVL